MHAELAATHERVHKLILVRDTAVSHRLEQMHHLLLLEKLTAWRRNDAFDRSEVLTEKQRRTQGCVYSVNDPEHCDFESRW